MDDDVLRTYTEVGNQTEWLHLGEVTEVTEVVVVHPKSLIVPPGACWAPPGISRDCGTVDADSAPSGFSMVYRRQQGGLHSRQRRLLFIAANEKERTSWVRRLRHAVESVVSEQRGGPALQHAGFALPIGGASSSSSGRVIPGQATPPSSYCIDGSPSNGGGSGHLSSGSNVGIGSSARAVHQPPAIYQPSPAPEVKHEGKGKSKGPPPPSAACKGKGKGPAPPSFGAVAKAVSGLVTGKGPPMVKGKGPPIVKGKAPGPPIVKGKECSPPDGKNGGSPPPAKGGAGASPEEQGNTVLKWIPVPKLKQGIENTVFDDLSPVAVNFDKLGDTFSRKPPAANAKLKLKSNEECILPTSAAMNFGIVMRKLHLDVKAFASAVADMDPDRCQLDAEEIERLQAVLPSTELLKKVDSYASSGKNIQKLRDVERALLPLAAIPRLEKRLELLFLGKTYNSKVTESMEKLEFLQLAIKEAENSGTLKKILGVVMALMSLNSTTKQGFDVTSLARLCEVKAPQGPFREFHMLHWVAQELMKEDSDFSTQSLDKELRMSHKASGVNLLTVRKELESLEQRLLFLRTEAKQHRVAYLSAPIVQEPVERAEVKTDKEEENKEEQREVEKYVMEDGDALCYRPTLTAGDKAMMSDVRGSRMGDTADQFTRFLQLTKLWGAPWLGGLTPEHFTGTVLKEGFVFKLRRPNVSSSSLVWKRCQAEVRAHHLVLQETRGERVRRTIALPLPGAEIVPLRSLFASEMAQTLGKEMTSSYGFEVNAPACGMVVLRCQDAKEADEWMDVLIKEALMAGAGTLWVNGSPQFAVVDIQRVELQIFSKSLDFALGKQPLQAIDLTAAAVRSFADGDECLSSKGQSAARRCSLFGFEVEDYTAADNSSNRVLVFDTDSMVSAGNWVGALLAAPRGQPAPRLSQVGRLSTFEARPSTIFEDVGHASLGASANGLQSFCVTFNLEEASKQLQPKDEAESLPSSDSTKVETCVAASSWTAAPDMAAMSKEISQKLDQRAAKAAAAKKAESDKKDGESDTSDSEAEDTAGSLTGSSSALRQLRVLEKAIATSLERLRRSLEATSGVGRGLLLYFGIPHRSTDEEAAMLMRFFEQLSQFQNQMRSATRMVAAHNGTGDDLGPATGRRRSLQVNAGRRDLAFNPAKRRGTIQ